MQKRKILVVDDQPEVVRSIVHQLTSSDQNLSFINAINGEIGCRLAEEETPDVIIMDWDMPVMDGIEATRKLRNNSATFDIPVIMATGHMTSPNDLKTALEAGATDYVRKPINAVELHARINTAIRIREQHEAIQDILKNDIEIKNRKLSATSMLIVEKNNLLHQFYEDLKGLQKEAEENCKLKAPLNKIRKRIVQHIEIDSSWETFKMHFEEVHPEFFVKLQEKSDQLTHRDLKLCSYLKMGMDNKQIAQLLNITLSSTRTALSRVKRKLDIPEELDLRNEINSFG